MRRMDRASLRLGRPTQDTHVRQTRKPTLPMPSTASLRLIIARAGRGRTEEDPR
jgi:hypothetical protein